MTIKQAIRDLQKIEEKYGNMPFNVYRSQDQATQTISEIVYDEGENDCYAATY